ncbi:MAG TPA: hypothetical protein VHM16_07920 [Rubrobacteraceae bacterium]|nr:hypothetical protein [Rubrobacteraceae bacterium]
MLRVALTVALVLAVVYAVPFVVYGLASVVVDLRPPGDASPALFLTSVFVSKLGTALAFVLIFYISRGSLSGQWFVYALLWWVMFVVGEIGQAIGPDYTWKEAMAGMVSETIYVPLAAYVTSWLIAVD